MKKSKKLIDLSKFAIEEHKNQVSLTVLFSITVFGIILISVALTAISAYVLSLFGLFNMGMEGGFNLTPLLIFMSLASLLIGFGIAMLTMKYPLKPVSSMITQMNRLAAGDFKARLEFKGAIGTHPAFKGVSESFNKMAEELESTELLRADFINNLSHEVKTPIVSIAGFAKLLKRGNLTEQQRAEYIDIIEEESLRLSDMATNVLNLSKVENQMILTDISHFNLSEQLRSSVLLLESKWAAKELKMVLNFDEYTIFANEELLKQVWINLLDNAVKFAPHRGTVGIKIDSFEDNLAVSIYNTGSEIPADKRDRIFNKFYQADESHTTEGNGVGLAIVKKIIELHSGEILVDSAEGITTFTAILPIED